LEIGVNYFRASIWIDEIHGRDSKPAAPTLGKICVDLRIHEMSDGPNSWNAAQVGFVATGVIDEKPAWV
jgi:hypothetical protein